MWVAWRGRVLGGLERVAWLVGVWVSRSVCIGQGMRSVSGPGGKGMKGLDCKSKYDPAIMSFEMGSRVKGLENVKGWRVGSQMGVEKA